MEETPRERLLVTPQWLAERLEQPGIQVFDIRGTILPPTAPPPWYRADRADYEAGHIPGAHFVDWLQDLVDHDAPIKSTMLSASAFAALMSRLGVTREDTLVLYDADAGHTAARLWWLCHHYGHRDVRLLDGGWLRWVGEEHITSSVQPQPTPSEYTIDTAALPTISLASMAEVREASAHGSAQLIDCRGPSMYRGETTRGAKSGHIPGAINLPRSRLVEGPYDTFKSNAAITALLAEAGIHLDQPAITYCNAGVSASAGLFALHLLGHTNAANYDGSWYEWESHPENPIAQDDK